MYLKTMFSDLENLVGNLEALPYKRIMTSLLLKDALFKRSSPW